MSQILLGLARRCWAAMATITSICRRGRWRAACRFPGAGNDLIVLDKLPSLTSRQTVPGQVDRVDVDGGAGSNRVIVNLAEALTSVLINVHHSDGRGRENLAGVNQLTINGTAQDETFLLRAGYLAKLTPQGRGLRRRGAARELRPDQHGRAAPERGGRRQSLLHRRHRHAGRHRRRPRQRSGKAQRVPDRPAVRAGPAAAQCGGGRPDRYRAHHAGAICRAATTMA